VADKTFAEIPGPFAFIVPGGAAPTMRALGDESLLAYVRTAGETAEVIGSVYTGSLILAAAGLLVGRKATTHWTVPSSSSGSVRTTSRSAGWRTAG